VVENVDPATFCVDVKKAGPQSKRIAVVGAGPAGLTAAHCLSVKGHRVTVYEKEKQPGGMLICAIPSYRLPREVLQQEIDSLLNENTELLTDMALGRDFTIDDLFEKGFDAVYLAMGAHRSRRLGISGEEAKGVLAGIEFLKAYNLHGQHLANGNVGIVGGGNSAIDAARVAKRQKGVTSVTVFYRRSEAEMPAYREEIDAAREEGIGIRELCAPVAITDREGVLQSVTFIQNELGQPDERGRRSPVPVDGSAFEEPLDTLIAAISEDPDIEDVTDIRQTKWGSLRVNPESFLTSRPGVFAGGDVVSGPNTVIAAVSDGKNAAEMIERYCLGRKLKKFDHVKLPSVYVAPVTSEEEMDDNATRVSSPHLPPSQREGNFAEVELAISRAQALCEARRCLRCDLDFTQPA
jgi:NADH-quinone oxidoreductase subunit F